MCMSFRDWEGGVGLGLGGWSGRVDWDWDREGGLGLGLGGWTGTGTGR